MMWFCNKLHGPFHISLQLGKFIIQSGITYRIKLVLLISLFDWQFVEKRFFFVIHIQLFRFDKEKTWVVQIDEWCLGCSVSCWIFKLLLLFLYTFITKAYYCIWRERGKKLFYFSFNSHVFDPPKYKRREKRFFLVSFSIICEWNERDSFHLIILSRYHYTIYHYLNFFSLLYSICRILLAHYWFAFWFIIFNQRRYIEK